MAVVVLIESAVMLVPVLGMVGLMKACQTRSHMETHTTYIVVVVSVVVVTVVIVNVLVDVRMVVTVSVVASASRSELATLWQIESQPTHKWFA